MIYIHELFCYIRSFHSNSLFRLPLQTVVLVAYLLKNVDPSITDVIEITLSLHSGQLYVYFANSQHILE